MLLKETTNSSIGFIILYLILDQKVQKKLHEELDGLTEGYDRKIVNQDKTKLPYTNAIIHVTKYNLKYWILGRTTFM